MNTNYTMKQAVKEAFKRILDYQGRSTRAAFWKFQLASALIIISLFCIIFAYFLIPISYIPSLEHERSSTNVEKIIANHSTALQSYEVTTITTVKCGEASPSTTFQSREISSNNAIKSEGTCAEICILTPLILFSILIIPLFILLALINLSLTCRRIADSGNNPLFILLTLLPMGNIVIIIFCCLDSEKGSNQWGPSLKYPE